MASLADDPSTAVAWVMQPMVAREVSRVDTGDNDALVYPVERVTQALRHRGKPPIETHHQDRALRKRRLDPAKLLLVKGQRLLDEHRLPGRESGSGELRVSSVPGRDDDRVDVVVLEYLVRRSCHPLKPVAGCNVCRRETGACENGCEASPLFPQRRYELRAREVARAYQSDSRTFGPGPPTGRARHACGGALRPSVVIADTFVLEQDAEGSALARYLDGVVSLRRRSHGKPVGREICDLDLSGGEKGEKCFKVPLFGPPDVSERQIAAAVFVVTVVPSRAVRPRQPDLQLLRIQERAVRGHWHVTHNDDSTSIAGKPRSELNRIRRRCGGGHNNGVDPRSITRRCDHRLNARVVGRERGEAAVASP